jgi:hypothetical protein
MSRLRRHVPLLSAACVFALGLLTLGNRIELPAFASAAGARTLAAETSRADRRQSTPTPPNPADCPCHKKHAP